MAFPIEEKNENAEDYEADIEKDLDEQIMSKAEIQARYK